MVLTRWEQNHAVSYYHHCCAKKTSSSLSLFYFRVVFLKEERRVSVFSFSYLIYEFLCDHGHIIIKTMRNDVATLFKKTQSHYARAKIGFELMMIILNFFNIPFHAFFTGAWCRTSTTLQVIKTWPTFNSTEFQLKIVGENLKFRLLAFHSTIEEEFFSFSRLLFERLFLLKSKQEMTDTLAVMNNQRKSQQPGR